MFVFRYRSPAHWIEVFRTYRAAGYEQTKGSSESFPPRPAKGPQVTTAS